MEELKRAMAAQQDERHEMNRQMEHLAVMQRQDKKGRVELEQQEAELKRKKVELMAAEAKARRQQRELEEERHRIKSIESQAEGRTPLYWVNQSAKGRWHLKEELATESPEFHAIQTLMDATFDETAVGCGWAGYSTKPMAAAAAAATMGGSVRLTRPPEKHSKLQVTKVTRIEDAKMWREYMQALEDIEPVSERTQFDDARTVTALRDEKLAADWTIASTLDSTKNEVLLWHGKLHANSELILVW